MPSPAIRNGKPFGEIETMPYKGGDLDLRGVGMASSREVPGIAERVFDPAWGPPAGAAPHAIAVDELVLACCNRAWDVAQFHGSGSVRLEHLLHALTRIEAAAAILGELGIRADSLRRDTAVAIAADMPAGTIDGTGAPRASPAFADALRRAAVEAHARRQPTSLHDLLRALLGAGPESPAAALLMRAAADPHRLERWRDEPRREALAPAQLVRMEAQATTQPPATDVLVARLDQMQASVQALREEAAADRRATGDLLRTLQAELQAWRTEAARAPADRSAAVDAMLEAKLGEFGQAMAALAGRIGAIDKLAAGNPWQALGARLEAVEGGIAGQTSKLADALNRALSQRRQEDEGRQIALEASIRAQVQAAEEAAKAREHELREIHDALVRIGASQQALSDSLAAWQVESSGDIGILSNRLQQLEQSALDLLDRLNGEVQQLRHELLEDEARRGNGFKRWLYGTGSVFATSWRDEAASIRQALDRSRASDKS